MAFNMIPSNTSNNTTTKNFDELGVKDIVLKRGNAATPGTLDYRAFINNKKVDYRNTPNGEKTLFCKKIVEDLKEKYGYSFWVYNEEDQSYHKVDQDDIIVKKVAQALRENGKNKGGESSKKQHKQPAKVPQALIASSIIHDCDSKPANQFYPNNSCMRRANSPEVGNFSESALQSTPPGECLNDCDVSAIESIIHNDYDSKLANQFYHNKSNFRPINRNLSESAWKSTFPGKWVDDAAIDNHLKILHKNIHPEHNCHFYDAYFMNQLQNVSGVFPRHNHGEYTYGNVVNWSSNISGGDIFALEKIFFIIHRTNHWMCAVADMRCRRISIYDSMHGSDKQYKKYVDDIYRYIQDEHIYRKGHDLPDADTWERNSETPSVLPRQTNDYDCGIYVLMVCEFLSKNYDINYLTPQYITKCRVRISLSIHQARILPIPHRESKSINGKESARMEIDRQSSYYAVGCNKAVRATYSHEPQQQQPQMQQHQIKQQQPQQPYTNLSNNMMRPDMGGATSPYMSSSINANPGQMVNLDDINPMAQNNGYSMSGMNDRSQRQPSSSGAMSSSNGNNSSRNSEEWRMRIRHKQQRLLLLHHSAKCPHESNCPVTQHCAEMKRPPPPVPQSSHTPQYPTVSNPPQPPLRQHRTLAPTPPPVAPVPSMNAPPPQQPFRQDARNPESRKVPAKNPEGTSSERHDTEWQKIRHKQKRLLLLRHASRCQHTEEVCPITPHCASMKKLWEHIAHCKNQQCTVPHCLSSRYVLTHYRRCKDQKCPACVPVRETIRKSSQREAEPQSTTPPPVFPSSDSMQSIAPLNGVMSDVIVESGPSTSPDVQSTISPVEREPKRAKTEAEVILTTEPEESAGKRLESEPSAYPPAVAPVVGPVKAEQKLDVKPNVDHSLLNSFPRKMLETHVASLDPETSLCTEVLKALRNHQYGFVFNAPVDPVSLELDDYFDIIKKPMDLGTVQMNLANGVYHCIDEFAADVNLTFDNATTYNEDGSKIFNIATEMKAKFSLDLKKLHDQLQAEDEQRRQNDRACTLCGCEKRLFEPPEYFCNNCRQRIRRNSYFYVGGNNQYLCKSCFYKIDDKSPIEPVDMTISKSDLKKKKNDEVHEESWVQCDSCKSRVHQICGLVNTRQNKEHHSAYCCPKCLLAKRKSTDITPGTRPPSAEDLPRTALSEWLEQNISKKVEMKKRELAEQKAKTENVSLEESLSYVESGGPIYVRQVTAMERKLEVGELMRARYAHKNYPEEFPFRCKCIVVFQELGGVDIILFALYVYEHGEDNPPPNQRVVYISYLDSVHFMRPRRMRTFVYHEILIAYLDYARKRGFATAHIWACPPKKGDDYIFFAKPEHQKNPKVDRLCQWYIDMLTECQKRDIVGKVTNLYDLYIANESLDATVVPYFEGDHFPGEAENIIKILSEGGGKKGSNAGKKKKSKATNNSQGNTGTRSTGVDEEAFLASGILDEAITLKDLDRDQVMVKLGEKIQPMKESFIVACLNWSGAKAEDMIVPKEIEKARKEYLESKRESDVTGSKRDADGELKSLTLSRVIKNGKAIKVIDDDVEDLDCEFLNNRQAFLNLCLGNHYQFDEVRRAKHTSMMVLWHLHNRDAPKFIQQCFACTRKILSGKRYHCNTCPEFDLCQECYTDPNASRGSCSHELVAIAVEPDSSQQRSGLSEAERKRRQRKLHIELIEHAARCTQMSCPSKHCPRMKKFLKHTSTCSVKVQGECKICKRMWTLLRIHAQKCKHPVCPVPHCLAIKKNMRQQASDGRPSPY